MPEPRVFTKEGEWFNKIDAFNVTIRNWCNR